MHSAHAEATRGSGDAAAARSSKEVVGAALCRVPVREVAGPPGQDELVKPVACDVLEADAAHGEEVAPVAADAVHGEETAPVEQSAVVEVPVAVDVMAIAWSGPTVSWWAKVWNASPPTAWRSGAAVTNTMTRDVWFAIWR